MVKNYAGNTAKRALITGATGYIGSNIVKRLVEDEWAVHVIIRPRSSLPFTPAIIEQITIHKYDGNQKTLFSIVQQANPTVVYHLASMAVAEHMPDDIDSMFQSNILFGTQLVEAMINAKVYNLINTGTFWQHYCNSDYDPVCLYAATKQAFECILTYYSNVRLLKIITLKLFDTYGPCDPRPKLFSLLERATKKKELLSMSPGKQLIDLVYIDDIVEAYILAANRIIDEKVEEYESYAVSSGTPLILKNVVELYEQIMEVKIPILWGGRPYREREVMVPWSKGAWLPEWYPKVTLCEGLKRMKSLDT